MSASRRTPDREPSGTSFVAIDFETADHAHDSACAVALVRVEDLRIVGREFCLLRPPRRQFVFSYVHGITWQHVVNQPTFGEAWPRLSRFLDGVPFLAAHNAAFDRSVLDACCRAAGLRPPTLPFSCTMRLARQRWRVYPTKLPDVCAFLGIPLRHHDAGSDAEACARILIESLKLAAGRVPSPSGSR